MGKKKNKYKIDFCDWRVYFKYLHIYVGGSHDNQLLNRMFLTPKVYFNVHLSEV